MIPVVLVVQIAPVDLLFQVDQVVLVCLADLYPHEDLSHQVYPVYQGNLEVQEYQPDPVDRMYLEDLVHPVNLSLL